MENTQALNTLEAMLSQGTVPAKDKEFTESLVRQYKMRGLSSKQWYWVTTLAERMLAPPPTPKAVADFTGVYAMFTKAREKIKYPKINLRLDDGCLVKLYVAGERSKVPDVINVVEPESETWYGRVHTDGRWEGGRGTPERTKAVEGLLTRLAADPEKVAAEYGRLTGNCCFCIRPLADARSIEVGYGPVCAKRFGLVWG